MAGKREVKRTKMKLVRLNRKRRWIVEGPEGVAKLMLPDGATAKVEKTK